jgi:hypothetical protein
VKTLVVSFLTVPTALACGASTTPAPASAARPVVLAPPMSSLSFYVGSWQCDGTSFATQGQAKEEHWKARMEVAPELDGKWLSVQMIGPKQNRTAEHKGFDPVARRWVHVAVGNDGSWVTMSSPGWTGSHMVWTPDASQEKYHATFTKLGEDRYAHLVVADTDHGEEKIWQKVCTKVRS